MAVNPVDFRSDRLPVDVFDARFSDDNMRFWVPLLIEAARIGEGTQVLDVGCGTGGFSRAIAAAASADVTGFDVSERFVERARLAEPPSSGSASWVVGDAERLPFAAGSFDRVLLSMVLHQLSDPAAAVGESFRVLRAAGLVLVRTIAPEDAGGRVPARYLPAMAQADAARLPHVGTLVALLEAAGFTIISVERLVRNKVLSLAEADRELVAEARWRYAFLSEHEVEDARRRMREDADARPGGWVDPRPTTIVVGSKPAG